ncbi:MAG TPA: aminotransferase class I/II-fold pyridoxal phosphate-dependent enzyme [Acidimicrobiia bacterium]
MATVVPFVPPPYPYERLDALKQVADVLPGGVVDCSIGTPCDPVPEIAAAAAADAATRSMGYPPSAGTAALHDAAAAWMHRCLGVEVAPTGVAACIGTKEMVVSLPHFLALARPGRDTVLYPAVAYPSYDMGATLAGLRGVPVPLDADWHVDLDAISAEDADRALLLWINEPGNPSSSVADRAYLERVAEWGRAHGVVVASDECYVEFAPEPATILSAGFEGVLAVHSLSKRSNLAGMRVGFFAGDPEIVHYLVETRKHAGLMVPTPAQAAAVAALSDDTHVGVQRTRYAERRALVVERLESVGLRHEGGPMLFYLWLRDDAGADGWAIADRLARVGLLVSPGDLYGDAGAPYARLALVQPRARLEPVLDRLVKEN